MESKDAGHVARRCLCLELLVQRLGLEVDEEDAKDVRDDLRKRWVGRIGDLGVEKALVPEERAYLDRAVGTLDEDDLDELHARSLGAVVLLWALGRLAERPTLAAMHDAPALVAEHGILGDGSIKAAKATIAGATLRPRQELEDALAAYAAGRGKGTDEDSPEEVASSLGHHHLAWILDREMKYEGSVRALVVPEE